MTDHNGGSTTMPDRTQRDVIEDHIRKVCEAAGFEGIMPPVYEILIDRDEEIDAVAWLSLTPDDVQRDFEEFVDPALTAITERLSS